jgi:hypothetical protein
MGSPPEEFKSILHQCNTFRCLQCGDSGIRGTFKMDDDGFEFWICDECRFKPKKLENRMTETAVTPPITEVKPEPEEQLELPLDEVDIFILEKVMKEVNPISMPLYITPSRGSYETADNQDIFDLRHRIIALAKKLRGE